MAFYLSPLVDVNEIDLTTTIPAVATSIGVIALRDTYKGAEKKQTFVTDESDLIRAFGEPDDGSYEDVLSALGFLKYGNKLYATRVMPGDATFAGITIPVGSGLTVDIDTVADGVGTTLGSLTGGTGYVTTSEVGVATTVAPAGGTGLTLDITTDGDAVTVATINSGGSGYTAADVLTIISGNSDATVVVTAVADGVVTGVTMASSGTGYVNGQVLPVLGGAGTGLEVTVVDGDANGIPESVTLTAGGSDYLDTDDGLQTFSDADGFTSNDLGFPTQTLADLPSEDPDDFGDDVTVTTAGDQIWAIAQSRGVWGNKVRIAFLDYETQRQMLTGEIDNDDYVAGGSFEQFAAQDNVIENDDELTAGSKNFLVTIQEMPQRKTTWVTRETFNVSTDTTALDDAGGKRFAEDVVNQQSNYIRIALAGSVVGDDFDPTMVQDGWYTFEGGTDGAYAPLELDAELIDAYRLYEDPETVDVNIIIDSGKSETVKRELVVMCEERLDCMLTADVPKTLVVNNKGNETVDLRDWRNGTGSFAGGNGFNQNTSYAALYGNWLEVYDKFNQKYRWVPASGYMAGIFARTDDVAEPWFAPAGLNRSVLTGVRRLAWNAKQGNRDILYSNGINPIVSFAGQGKVVWGQKTMLSKPSAFDRINVRRLFMVLEKAISTAAKYFLFEPNDTATRVLLVAMIEPFLRDVQSRRGIFDFKVVCDESNNTPERIDRNELWCDIFIKPTRTAEFIVLNFVATKTGASFEEAAQAV
jgi:hypothetical protein